ncbi:Protein XAP5 CIRCADIAN TIMEKEEPER [Zea mays]|uniref:Protein XAP5 CIRCADIAN TIMEKEEPER n=1 Tax=Zea mays TaxID=4577 RepID=A0A1D6NRD2_MAIZE|nr:Protein XAP5 CIRCADIAN TIMEKEEPER [Zea mays]
MLVEDHLRSQAQHFCTSLTGDSITSSTSMTSLAASRSNSLNTAGKDPMAAGVPRRASLSSDAGGLPLDVYEPPPEFQSLTLTGMGLDTNGEFLMAMQQQLVHEIREVWTNSVENLLYMKEDLIIPHGCVHSLYC